MIKTTFKAHPIMILSLMRPYIFVLVLPLVRALIQYVTTGQIDGLLNLEIIAFSIVLTIAILSYRAISVTVSDQYLTVKKGIFIKRRAVIELSRLSSVVLRRNIADLLFGSVECAINTEAGRPQKSDFAFKMYIRDTKRLFAMVYGDEARTTIKFSPTKIALLAATTSSAFSGMVIGVPVINQLGDLLGVALSDMFLNEINSISSKLDTVFPPIINTISLVLLAAYAISFLTTFLKNVNFKLLSDKNNIEIKSGLIVRRYIVFKKSKVNNVCIEQTPLMRLARRYSMRASIGGYSDKKGEKSVVVPAATYKSLIKELKTQFLQYNVGKNIINPLHTKANRNRFFFAPIVCAFAIIAAGAVTAILFEHFKSLIVFTTLVLFGIDAYYAYVCYCKYKRGKLCFNDSVFASGMFGFNTREMYCDKNNIGIIKIIQTPADRRYKTCKLKLTVRSEQADSIRVNNIDLKTALTEIKNNFSLQKTPFNE
ncbi:MAG: PH domain-containing protein [Clostridia bacterium]|nr:PH domain-containing protein [Clostridia bacterium]